MNRRAFLMTGTPVILQAAGSPLCAWAQAARAPYRIGWLTPERIEAAESSLREALRDMGYSEGRNLVIEYRSADGDVGRLAGLAADLAASKVDLILGISPPAIAAAYRATRSIPIVMAFWGGEGLFESGMARNLSHPGGNVTGVNMLADDMDLKRVQLLREIVPTARRMAVLDPPVVRFSPGELQQLSRAAGAPLRSFPVGQGRDRYRLAFEAMAAARVDSLMVPSSPQFFRDTLKIVDLAARHRLPAIYEWAVMARQGGLAAYGPNLDALQGRVAYFVDRILKGARPGDLPIEQPATFELAVNMTTAKALGLTIPQEILLRADRVIS